MIHTKPYGRYLSERERDRKIKKKRPYHNFILNRLVDNLFSHMFSDCASRQTQGMLRGYTRVKLVPEPYGSYKFRVRGNNIRSKYSRRDLDGNIV